MIDSATATSSSTPQRRWQPLGAIDRRVVGVLAEKAKTTPDTYPMSLNAVCTGCNQKNNRAPLMQIDPEEAEESLDRLREFGAVGLIEGYGRVAKYRHYLYEWLGVDKVELAVMTELLLRGDQTVGELRGRAARMEPIADLAALRPVLESLRAKGLVVSLTPEGRGHVVTHALYKPRELELLRTKYQGYSAGEATGSSEEDTGEQLFSTPAAVMPKAIQRTPISAVSSSSPSDVAALRRELDELRNQVAQLRSDFDELHIAHQTVLDELHALKDALGG
jgi:uncharacterized protein YceH (UPF0502 family)